MTMSFSAVARRGFLICAFQVLLPLAAIGAGESAEVLFPYSSIGQVRVSPTSRWVAAVARRADIEAVMLQRIGYPRVEVILTAGYIGRIDWAGPDTLILSAGHASGPSRVFVGKLRIGEVGIEVDKSWIDAPGWLVHPLPLVDGEVVWEFEHGGRNTIHRVELAELAGWRNGGSRRSTPRTTGKLLAEIRGSVHRWVVDRDGVPHAAWRRDEGGYTILSRAGSGRDFEEVYRYADDETAREVVPHVLGENGRLLAFAYGDGDTRGIYEFDPRTGTLGSPIFVHDEVDVVDLQTDALTGALISVVYGDSGQTRFHYFPEYRDAFLSRITDERKQQTLAVVSTTLDRTNFVFAEFGATNPGDFYFQDATDKAVLIARIGDEIDRNKLTPVESFRVASSDGVEVEAFLSIPRGGAGPAPLVVMPHGGPIGVHDSREYDPVVQYLASWGFAVLQVNYRGSSGYGRSFEELGKKQWAKGIEDDIDAAVEQAMARPEVDGKRVCIVGGSYGGFSALASLIRHPGRYRCAVTLNGVSDIPLLYDSSDFADSKRAMEFYEEFVGDLETERAKLIEISPAYHASKIDAPVLVVYGTEDRRVDPDHAHRLILMLELYGKEHQEITVQGAEHSFDRAEFIVVARALRRFLTTHLMPGVAFVRDRRAPHELDMR